MSACAPSVEGKIKMIGAKKGSVHSGGQGVRRAPVELRTSSFSVSRLLR